MHYCIVHFLTMLRKEESIGFFSRAEDRGENVKGRGFNIYQRFIYLIVYYYLYFLERARFMKFVGIRAWIKQNKTWLIYGGSFRGQETSLVTSIDG